MKRPVKIIITILVIALIGTGIYMIQYFMKRTIFNDTMVLGNTSGNLYNSGIFCEQGDRIYFSNFQDNGSLYSMNLNCKDVKKLSTDKIRSICADDNYIYYTRINNMKEESVQGFFIFNNTGIYRVKHDGSSIISLYDKPSGMMQLYGNYLYYQHYTEKDGTELYKVKIDATEEEKLSKEFIFPGTIYENSLYYTGNQNDHSIHKMNLNNGSISTFVSESTFMPILGNDGIYYISTQEGYNLCRVDFDGKNKVTIVEEFCSSFNISPDNKFLYYQVDGGDNNRIEVLNLSDMSQQTILPGDFKWLNVTSNYLFFVDFNETAVYAYSTDGILNSFVPPVEE